MMQRTFHLKALLDGELHGISIMCQPDPPITDLSATLNGESVTLVTEAVDEDFAFNALDLGDAPRPVKAGETLVLVVDDPRERVVSGRASLYKPHTFAMDAQEVDLTQAWEITEGNEQTTAIAVTSRAMASTGRLELRPEVLPGFPEARPGQVLTRTEADVKWGDVSSVFPIYLSGPEKNVSQPLDPVDFPVVQYADDLQPGGVARVESELKYRRPDGTLVSLGGGGGLNAVINEEGYYESTDGPEDQPATMTNAELIAAVTEQLRQPQIIDGLKYASPELNYDSARDGWEPMAGLTPANLQQRFTNYYSLGVPGRLYTRTGGLNIRNGNFTLGGGSAPIAVGDVISTAFTVTTPVKADTFMVAIPPNGNYVNGLLRFQLRVLQDGAVIYDSEKTVTAVFGEATGFGFGTPLDLQPGDYVLEYKLLEASTDHLKQAVTHAGSLDANTPQAPFAQESFRMFHNGTDLGPNAMLALEVPWTDQVLAQPVTITPEGEDLLIAGVGAVVMTRPVAGLPRRLNSGRHRMIIEFTPEPESADDLYAFGLQLAPAIPTMAPENYTPIFLAERALSPTYGTVASRTMPFACRMDIAHGSGGELPQEFPGTPPRLRLEITVEYQNYQEPIGIPKEDYALDFKLFNGDTGTLLASPMRVSSAPGAVVGGSMDPRLFFTLTPSFRQEPKSVKYTRRSFGPEGSEKPARIRVHRWIEWRENA